VGKHPTPLRDNFLAYERQPELISSYAVIKKWLSYQGKELLGRGLTVDEARSVSQLSCGRQETAHAERLTRIIRDFRSTKGLAMVQIRCLGGFDTKIEAFA
jgi:hypothetical protein